MEGDNGTELLVMLGFFNCVHNCDFFVIADGLAVRKDKILWIRKKKVLRRAIGAKQALCHIGWTEKC